MADYRSTLTGTQMDAALLDMAEHNSEAYAVGERNGIAVASDDVTYHNNARYYAQIASSQIVGDASSAVRWDTDQSEALTDAQKAQARENINAASDSDVVKITAQTLTSAEQAQARANIAAGGSNRNLLDNPWWGLNEVVNQRGNTSGQTTHDAYSIDRWKMSYGSALGSWSIAEDGITITAASGTYALFGQVLANKDAIEGKTVTASVLLGDGTIVSGTIPSFTWATNPIAYEHNGLQLRFIASETFRVNVTGGNSKTIRAVKVEVGPVSTLADDAPPDYAEELAKCKYYFRRITNIGRGRLVIGVGFSGGVEVPNIFGVGNEMRKTTSLAVTYSGSFVVSAGTDIAVTSISRNENNSNFGLSFAASGITPYSLYSILGSAGAYIDISADL